MLLFDGSDDVIDDREDTFEDIELIVDEYGEIVEFDNYYPWYEENR